MKDDASYARYFAYLNLFLFFMLLLVLGRSLLVLFVGWEGVGLASYLLIGFWFEDPNKARAGKKAFITNRIGDAGFLLGMFLLYQALGTLDMDRINAAFMGATPPAVSASLVGILLFIGASGKSAQIPLHVWLPDAMAGPTPVSALIHAATMVTAGVYLVARMSGIYLHAPEASAVIAAIGVATAFFAATIAVVQTDIKKVLAYSTISQLGFMFVALGVGAYGVGDLPPLHARLLQGLPLPRRRQRDPRARRRAGHPQDGRARAPDSGHLRDLRGRHRRDRRHPAARRLLLQGRDPLVRASPASAAARRCSSSSLPPTALLTAFYMFRLLWLTFFGRSRMSAEVEHHVHESPLSMTGVLVVLAMLSAIGGFLVDAALPRAAAAAAAPSCPRSSTSRRRSSSVSIAIAFAGLAGAAFVFGGDGAARRARCAARFPALHRVLSGKYLRRRSLRRADRPAAVLDLRSRLPAPRRPDALRRHAARPRRARAAHRRRARARAERQPAPLRAARAGRDRRFARVELAPWLTPRSSTSSCSCRSSAIAAIIALPAAARDRRARAFARRDARAVRAHRLALHALRRRRSTACSSRRGCRGSPPGASTTRSASTATTCCSCC